MRYEDVVLAENPTCYWPLGRDALDIGTQRLHGSYQLSPLPQRPGPPRVGGLSTRWDNASGSTQYIDIGNLSALNVVAGAYTLMAWVRPITAGSNFSGVIGRGQNPDAFSNRTFTINLNTDWSIALAQFVGGSQFAVTGSTALKINNWSLVIAMCDAATLWVNIDGIAVGNAGCGGNANNPNSRSFEIGRCQGVPSANSAYDLAHVAYWNYKALSLNAIGRLCSLGVPRRGRRRRL